MLGFLLSLALSTPAASFDVVALGVQGGLAEDDLTCFLVSKSGEHSYLALDAGTVARGLKKLDGVPQKVLREQIKGWAITHPHLDHINGLAHAAVDDPGPKPLYALSPTVDALRDHVFNGVVWANFGDEGKAPLRRLLYKRLHPGKAMAVENTPFIIEALPLSHAGATSTAFLVGDDNATLAFLGDTGPDLVENSNKLDLLWQRLAPLVRGKRLKAIFVEVSWPSEQKDPLLFGHLTPRHLMSELSALAANVDPTSPSTALAGLPVIIMHIKPTLSGEVQPRTVIKSELEARNKVGVKLLFPDQGDRFSL